MKNQRNFLKAQWKRWLVIIVIMLMTVFLFQMQTVPVVQAQDDEDIPITIYLFWGEGCPHCASEKEFLTELMTKYPSLQVEDFEIYNDSDNLNLLKEFAAAYGFNPTGVPATFIGDEYFIGFSDELGDELEKMIQAHLATGTYPDPMDRVRPSEESTEPTPVPADSQSTQGNTSEINVPLFGTIDLSQYSMLASTIIIAVVDGVNPCSLWVLSMLIALSLHTGSRKKVLLIGFVFLTVSSLIYALFILGLFSVLTIASVAGWVQVAVALVAAVFALINIKDYFWYKEGVSLTIDDAKKPGIFKKMRKVMDASDSFWGTIGATIVLAAGVSLVEFSCTAGLPMVWTNLLTSQGTGGWEFVLLLLVYMIIYQIDEMFIFIPAALSLKSKRFEEHHGRILKLIGGILMLTLSAVMIINPAMMNEIGNTLLIFAVALGLTGMVLVMHKKVLPSMGIYIGSDQKPRRKRKRDR